MSRIAGIFIVAGAAAVTLPPPVMAQTFLPAGLSIDLSGRAVYDSNQLRLPKNTPLTPGQQRDDIRYSPAISAEYSRDVGPRTVYVTGLVGRDFYQNNSDLDRSRLAASAGLTTGVGARCSATINGSFSRRQNGLSGISAFNDGTGEPPLATDPPPIPDPGIIDDEVGRLIDNSQDSVSYGAGIGCGSAGGGLTFGGDARRSTLENGAPTRRFADSNNTGYSAYVGLGLFGPGQLQVNGSYSTIRYPNRASGQGGAGEFFGPNSLDSYQVGLSYSRPIGSRLSGSIGASYLTARPDGAGEPYNAPAYNVSLGYNSGLRLSATLSASRAIQSSNSVGALYSIVDQVRLGASYKIGNSIRARAQASIERRDFRQTFATIDEQVARGKETVKIVGIGVNYTPRPLYDVGFDVRQSFRSSTPSFFDYDSTTATVSLGVHF